MYGAFLGDLAGSPYEFNNGAHGKVQAASVKLLSEEAHFTDDSVLTAAVADALLDHIEALKHNKDTSDEMLKRRITLKLLKFANNHPDVGYGQGFKKWLKDEELKPYNSFGNGSAMRVSPVGWLFDNIEDTRKISVLTASITHNHPEGIKGAEATASAVFLARVGTTKKHIKQYIEKNFKLDLSKSCDDYIRSDFKGIDCQTAVPAALTAFFESSDFETALRNAISFGGDSDTLASIAGSIAEAYYGIPDELVLECRKHLSSDLIETADRFDKAIGRRKYETEEENQFADAAMAAEVENRQIEEAMKALKEEDNEINILGVLKAIINAIRSGGRFYVPVNISEDFMAELVKNLSEGKKSFSEEHFDIPVQVLSTSDGKQWVPACTGKESLIENGTAAAKFEPIQKLLKNVLDMDEVNGIILNPWSTPSMPISKKMIKFILKRFNDENQNK